ncbi:MAG: DUF4139 domain-containing protein [bacterium]|nr:DUF4139 domain-containing protein [bacterium]
MKTLITIACVLVCAVTAVGQSLELTVYNSDLALVKEVRTIDLRSGVQEFPYAGVPKALIPESVRFRSLRDPDGTSVLEQNYRYDLLDRASLLERYKGKEVLAKVGDSWKTVRLLAHGNPTDDEPLGRILQVGGEIHIEGFILPELPEGLLLEPSLVWLLDADKGGEHQVELTYLTDSIGWRADYVAVVDDDNALDLTGWVTLNNRSGMDYENANLKLVAGDVNRVRQAFEVRGAEYMVDAPMAAKSAGFQEESFFEYHLYGLDRPTTVLDNEQKQVELLHADRIEAERVYTFRARTNQTDHTPRSVGVTLEFMNSEGAGAGMALPQGIVRVYQADSGGQLQFAGEDRLVHTPIDEEVKLRLGEAFDIRGEHESRKLVKLSERSWRQQAEFELRNHKEQDIVVEAIIQVVAREWSVDRASQDHEQRGRNELVFQVKVPARGETKVSYTVTMNN